MAQKWQLYMELVEPMKGDRNGVHSHLPSA